MLWMGSYHITLQKHPSTQLKRGGTFFSHFPWQSLQQLFKIIPLWIIFPEINLLEILNLLPILIWQEQ